jgi:hypothetical protein
MVYNRPSRKEALMAEPEQMDKKKINIQIQLDEDVAQGAYVNLAMVNHSETEFILDFIYVQPQQPKAKVRARILSSPKHTKRLLEALKDNIAKYEKRFGVIDISGPLPEEEFLH